MGRNIYSNSNSNNSNSGSTNARDETSICTVTHETNISDTTLADTTSDILLATIAVGDIQV